MALLEKLGSRAQPQNCGKFVLLLNKSYFSHSFVTLWYNFVGRRVPADKRERLWPLSYATDVHLFSAISNKLRYVSAHVALQLRVTKALKGTKTTRFCDYRAANRSSRLVIADLTTRATMHFGKMVLAFSLSGPLFSISACCFPRA